MNSVRNASKGPQVSTNNSGRSVNNAASKNAAANSTNAATGEQGKSKMPMIIIIVVTILLFVFVIIWITFAMKSSNLKGKVITTAPIQLEKNDKAIKVGASEFPAGNVGREYTYSFWMYVEDFKRQDGHGMIMYRGNPGSVREANPIVMMDKDSNKLYIVIRTNGSTLASGVDGNLDLIMSKNYFMQPHLSTQSGDVNYHLICPIDFIPLQRWVHVVSVVDNKLVTLYLDGQIYSVKSTDEFKATRQPETDKLGKPVTYNVVIDKTENELIIGKSSVGNNFTTDGFLGKVEFFNYAITMEDVKKIYERGPMPGGFLSWLGLSQYGFRSPIYNLSEA